ncbi:MAG: flippase-like domain-containing protein [Gemmatimonadota bacterium]|nr:flippase-like domain-containing protein [Gemmatimonadota bacterium]MDH5197505.1 flippase-like domain-containing protein [Gemmatimonadota bacterium]
MAVLTPRLFRRGLEIFAAISLLGLAGLLLYGNNLERFAQAILHLKLSWLLLGVGIASLDWFGGGLRLYVVARHVFPQQSLKGAILAGGLNTWAAYLTPSQTGGGPMMVYVLKRYGTPLPEAMVASLMTFVATVIFFAIAGPTAVVLGAGRSLGDHGVIGQSFDLFDLFAVSLGGFLAVGLGIVLLIAFPGLGRRLAGLVRRLAERRGRDALAARIATAEEGVDRAHAAVRRFATPRGLLATLACVVLSALAHGNKLVAGFVVLKMLGIHVNFVDVVLLQTLITFLIYFAPTPGGSGLAELISAAVMSIYVPRDLTPSYILLWRVLVSYLTVGFGSVVFWRWLKEADRLGEGPEAMTVGGDSVAPGPGAT